MGRTVTDFLTPTPTFWVGAGSVFALGGNYFQYNTSRTPLEADERALRSDWEMTGQDLQDAARREALSKLVANGDK